MKTPHTEKKLYDNLLGVKGWLYGGPYGLERYLYTLHRVTGLGVLVYLIMHIGVTWFKNDPDRWVECMAVLDNPFFKCGEYLVFFGVVFHAINGIRLIIGEFGYLLGKPKLPVYPYPLALLRQRPLALVLMLLMGILALYGFFDIVLFSHH
jgi:succinate dehydrogenase / fumarate reductase, cytochrome b subunit